MLRMDHDILCSVLALDVGTSSVRAILYAAEGATQGAALPHTEVQIAHTVTATPDGGAELDPESLFAETLQAIDGALARARHDATIVGVALSTLWHSVLGVDESGAAIAPRKASQLTPWTEVSPLSTPRR